MGEPGTFLVRARALTGFAGLVAAQGGDAAALIERAGIARQVLDTPDVAIPLDRIAILLDDAATSLGVPDFGIRLAARQDLSVLGAIALIAQHAATVGDALRGVSRNLSYHSPGARLTLVEDDRAERTEMRYDITLGPGVPRRQAVELSYAVALGFLRLVTGADCSDWSIGFRHTVGLSATRYRKAFGCRVQLGDDVDKLAFPTRLLGAPVNPGSVELRRAAERFVNNLVRRYPLDVPQQVHALVERQLATGACGISLVAGQMGMHTRTLQRRLDAHGLRFEDIVDSVRRERANELLPHSAIPLSVVGELLGYSEQSSFIRACRRWFDRTPQAMRVTLEGVSAR